MSTETIYKVNDRIDALRERAASLTEEAKAFLAIGIAAAATCGAILLDGLIF